MYSVYLLCLLLFSISPSLCSSSENGDYIEVDNALDWDGSGEFDVDDIDIDIDVNATDPSNDDTDESSTEVNDMPEKTTKQITIDDVLAAEIKVQELSAVLKTTIHRIRQQYKKMDIVFLIDSSSSVGKSNFRSELRFVIKFLSDFNVSFNYTRVSIVTFSSQDKIVCKFDQNGIFNVQFHIACFFKYQIDKNQVRHVDHISEANSDNDKCKLLNSQMPAIDFAGGGTHTADALQQAKVWWKQ